MTLFKPLLIIAVLVTLAGCGIKPKELTPPDAGSANPTTYPRTYPDPTL